MTVKRKKEIKIRVTDEEFEKLLARSTRIQLATWMRESCLRERRKCPKPVPKVDADLLRQLVGLGNNLNQIAKAVHSKDWNPLDRVKVIALLAGIEEQLIELKKQHTK